MPQTAAWSWARCAGRILHCRCDEMTTTRLRSMQASLEPDLALDELISRLIIANASARTRNERTRRRIVRGVESVAVPVVPPSSSLTVHHRQGVDVAVTPKTERAPLEQP